MNSRSLMRRIPCGCLFLVPSLLASANPVAADSGAARVAAADASATPSQDPVSPPAPDAPSVANPDPFDVAASEVAATGSAQERLNRWITFLVQFPTHPKAGVAADEARAQARVLGLDSTFLHDALALLTVGQEAPRAAAADRLGLAMDPRALPLLRYVLVDESVSVRVSVTRAIGRFVSAEAEALLASIINDRFPTPIRVEAADGLANQMTVSARDTLLSVRRNEKVEREVREAATRALEKSWPGYLASLGEGQKVLDRKGRWLLVPAAAGFGGYAMGTIGRFGQANGAEAIGALSGIALGTTTAILLTQKNQMSMANAVSIISGGGWGLWGGITMGRLIKPASDCVTTVTYDPEPYPEYNGYSYDPPPYTYESLDYACNERRMDLVYGLGLVGESAGLIATSLTLSRNPFTVGDLFTTNIGGLLAHNAALGGMILANPEDDIDSRGELGGILAASYAGLAASAFVAPDMKFTSGDVALSLQGGIQGGYIGGFMPLLLEANPDANKTSGGILLGSALGMAGSMALAQFTDFSAGDNAWMGFGSWMGYMAGAGIPMMLEADTQPTVGSMLAGGIVGLGSAYYFRDRVTFSAGDLATLGVGLGLGLWHGIGIGTYADENGGYTAKQAAGTMLLTSAVGGVAAAALDQYMELSPWEVAMTASGGVWAAWITGWARNLQSRNETNMLPVVIATDAGMAVSGLLLSPLVGVHPTRIGWANVGGLAGSAIFSLVGAMSTSDREKLITANLMGSVLGLVGGGIAGSLVKVEGGSSPRKRRVTSLERALDWNPQLSFQPWLAEGPGGRQSYEGMLLNLSLRQPVR